MNDHARKPAVDSIRWTLSRPLVLLPLAGDLLTARHLLALYAAGRSGAGRFGAGGIPAAFLLAGLLLAGCILTAGRARAQVENESARLDSTLWIEPAALQGIPLPSKGDTAADEKAPGEPSPPHAEALARLRDEVPSGLAYATPTRSEQALANARADYQATGRARIIRDGTTLVLPYGRMQPVLKTTVLRFTLVELGQNEYVKDRFIGDSLRWSVDYGVLGVEGNFRQIVAIKPSECGISTNLALTTNRMRIYNLALESDPCEMEGSRNPQGEYAVHVRFWYPEGSRFRPLTPPEATAGAGDWEQRSAFGQDPFAPDPPRQVDLQGAFRGTAVALTRRTAGYNPAPGGADLWSEQGGRGMPTVSAEDLHTAYEIDAGRGFPCPPVSVSDDGNRMFIRFPADGPRCSERFPLFAEGEDGDLQLINYSVYDGHLYVTSGVPTRAVILYQNERGRQRRVDIVRKEAPGERRRARRRR